MKLRSTRLLQFFPALCLMVGVVEAQVVFGPEYRQPELRVAPGQIVTVFVAGQRSVVNAEIRPQSGLAANGLGAFRVTLRQGPPEREIEVPLLSVKPYSNCGSSAVPCIDRQMLGITMQIPYEATVNASSVPLPVTSGGGSAVLSVYENGEKLVDRRMSAIQSDAIHILNDCDSANPFVSTGGGDGRCWPIATLGDGSLLRKGQNLRAGEVVTLYPKSGSCPPPAAPIRSCFPAGTRQTPQRS
jgi:hypothetical protein